MTTLALTIDFEDWHSGIPIDAALRDRLPKRLDLSGNRLLDLLDEHGIRATFFFLGPLAREYRVLARRIAADHAAHGLLSSRGPQPICR